MNSEGVWRSIFLFRRWLMPYAWTRQSQCWICMQAKLVTMTSRPGGDGAQGSAEHSWDHPSGVSFRINVQELCWHTKSCFKLYTCEISKHRKLLHVTAWRSAYISSRSWPMPCASTKPSKFFSSAATRLAMTDLRSGGWSDVDHLREVVWEWIDLNWDLWSTNGSHGKSPDLIRGFIVEPWTFSGFNRLLDSLLEHRSSTLLLSIEGMIVLWED